MVVLLLPLSLAMDNGAVAKMAVNNGSGSGGGGSVGGGDGVQWRSMVAAAFDRGNATTSQHGERAAQQEDKKVAQGKIIANMLSWYWITHLRLIDSIGFD